MYKHLNARRLLAATVPVLMGEPAKLAKNLPGALATWKALALAGANTMLVYGIGDSIGVGYNCADMLADGWMYQVAAALQALYGSGPVIYPGNHASWTETGTWSDSATGQDYGPFKNIGVGVTDIWRGRVSSEENATKTLTFTGTNLDLYYYLYGATSKFQVSMDGGDFENVDAFPTGATITARRWSGLGAGEHTLVIKVAAGTYAWIHAAHAYSNSGVSFFSLSQGSAIINTYTNNLYIASALSTIPSDIKILWLVSLTTNDYGAQTALATFKSKTVALLNALKARGDVLIVAENWQVTPHTIPQIKYDQIYQSLAVGNVGMIRIAKKWGTGAQSIAAGYVEEVSGVHPVELGHTDYKDVIMSKAFS